MVNRRINLKNLIGRYSSAFLFGARGVGKTYLLKHEQNNFKPYVAIDMLNYDVFSRYLKNPELFRKEIELEIEKNKTKEILTVFVDEIQKIPVLLDEIHFLIENYKRKVRFLLTGSSARKLKRGGANLLAGRAFTFKLHPFSSYEVKMDIMKVLQIGTLPFIFSESESPERSLKAYVETYLKEEIMQEALVRKIDAYYQFLEIAAQFNAEPLNFTKVSKGCNVSVKTVQDYYSILEDTHLVHKLNGWSYSVKKQLLKSPKYYFFDCGVLNALTGELLTELKTSSYRFGKLFETFIIQEVIRENDYSEAGYKFYYWKTNSGLEVDLILSKGPRFKPIVIEIKSKKQVTRSDLKGLFEFAKENNCICYVFYNSPKAYKIDNILILPWKEGMKKIFKKNSR